ncbi:MAG: hypothetical protein WCI47_02580 [bacterium]
MSEKMNLSKAKFIAVITLAVVIALVASLVGHEDVSAKSTQSSMDTVRLIQAIQVIQNRIPRTPILHFHGRSRGSMARQVPTLVASPSAAAVMRMPGFRNYRWTLTKTRTKSVVKWLKDNEAKSDVAVVGGSAAVCGLIFSETVLGAPLAAAFCALLIAFYMADIKDAKNKLTIKRACLQVTASTAPGTFLSWLSFNAVKCKKVK